MRAIPSILVLAVCAVAADQPAELVTCAVTHDATGVTTVKVHNGGNSAITGFSFIYVLQREVNGAAYGATTGYYDSLTDPQYARELPPGQDLVLPFRFGGNGYFA